MLDSVLIVAPATMLTHWLRELQVWAPGLRRVIVHRSGEADGIARVVSKGMLRSLQRWLKKAREDRVNEPIDEDDFRNPSNPEHMFCGVGYAVVTTYDNIRRSQDEWTGHNWSYVVLDEGQVGRLYRDILLCTVLTQSSENTKSVSVSSIMRVYLAQ